MYLHSTSVVKIITHKMCLNIYRCVVVLFNSKKNKFHYLFNTSRLVCNLIVYMIMC